MAVLVIIDKTISKMSNCFVLLKGHFSIMKPNGHANRYLMRKSNIDLKQ